jgi:glycosyltransferase involved in cell wall biosynthesis
LFQKVHHRNKIRNQNNMKLSVCIPVLNQHPLFRSVYKQLFAVSEKDITTAKGIVKGCDVELVIIDNGSTIPLEDKDAPGANIVRNQKSIGVYPTFKQGMDNTTGDIVAFFHSDLVVWEQGWQDRVLEAFNKYPDLGLIGFVGSNEMDSNSGRGGGTTSNFMGNTMVTGEGVWKGSPARAHGMVGNDISPAAVVDGCAMIIRRTAWEKIGFRQDFPLHHFYDRLISAQMLESGFKVAVLGIACDHISGQTVNQEQSYQDMAKDWCVARGIGLMPEDNGNWDAAMYKTAERVFLQEYRNQKHIVPHKAIW